MYVFDNDAIAMLIESPSDVIMDARTGIHLIQIQRNGR